MIQFKRGLKANLPVLKEGEPAFTKDTKEFFVGSPDGNVQLAGKEEVSTLSNQIGIVKENVIHLSTYSPDKNGTTDIRQKLVDAANALAAIGGGKLVVTNGSYLISTPYSLPDNVHLEGVGQVTFKSSYQAEEVGLIQMNGTIDATTYTLSSDALEGSLSMVVSGGTFVSGDYIYLSQDSITSNFSSASDSDHRKSYIDQLLQIQSVSGTTITLTEPLSSSYYTTSNAKIQKVTPKKNCSVKNISFDHMGTTQPVHSVEIKYAVNCRAENISSSNGAGKGVLVFKSRDFTVDGVRTDKRTDTNAGRGYSIMVAASSHGSVKRVYGFGTRHTVDFANGAHNVSVSDCFAFNNVTAAFSSHGQNCKKITFDNCHAVGGMYGFAFGNGTYKFDTGIQASNCTAHGATSVGFTFLQGTEDSQFSNCVATKCNNGFELYTAKDCNLSNCVSVDSTIRGLNIDQSSDNIEISNFKIKGTSGEGVAVVRSSKNVQISNLSIKGKLTTGYAILMNGSGITNVRIKNLKIDVDQTGTGKSMINISSSVTKVKINGFSIDGTTDTYAFETITSCFDIQLLNGSIDATVGIDSVRAATTTSDTTNNVLFNNVTINANGSYLDKKAVRAAAKDIRFINCNINGKILSLGTNKFMFVFNKLVGDLDVRATTGIVYTNNMGTISVWNMPAHDGTNVIRQNNLENVA